METVHVIECDCSLLSESPSPSSGKEVGSVARLMLPGVRV
jgi:hypothetical protein